RRNIDRPRGSHCTSANRRTRLLREARLARPVAAVGSQPRSATVMKIRSPNVSPNRSERWLVRKGRDVMQQTREISVAEPVCDGTEQCNWKGDVCYFPCVVAQASSVDDLVRIMKDQERYPSPIRAAGSQHSTTACIEANGGTIVDVTKLDKILAIDDHALTIT